MIQVFLSSLGCRLNEAEKEQWSRRFVAAGHRVVATPADAQVMILNTCAVTHEATRKSRQFVNRLHRLNPSARLVITGCYAALEPDQVAQLTGVDLVISNEAKENLVQIIERELAIPTMPARAIDADQSHVYGGARTRAFIKAQDGCRNRCTFCVVTLARGSERSRPVAEIVAEVHALQASGYQEIVLTGVHLGGYGADLGTDLMGLISALLSDTDLPRIRLSSLEPWDLREDFWQLWEHPRLMPHLHLPLQSGCDQTLIRMARRCTTSSYRALVTTARQAIPGLTITTDVIVGFPGETEEEWQTTLDYVQEIDFGHIHIFNYSPRQGTTAARLPDHVDGPTRRHRSRQLHAVAAAMKGAHLSRFLGTERAVLWEGNDETESHSQVRHWQGYTDNYLRVETAVPAGIDLSNTILPCRLVDVVGHPPHRLLASLDQPSTRVAWPGTKSIAARSNLP